MNWYGKFNIYGKPMSQSFTGCNFLNIGDILMLQRENEALDEYILIMSTNVTYSTKA